MGFENYKTIPKTSKIYKPHNTGIAVSMKMVKSQGAPNLSISFKPFLNDQVFGGVDPVHFRVTIGSDADFGKIRLMRCAQSEDTIQSVVRNLRGDRCYHMLKLHRLRMFGYRHRKIEMVHWIELMPGVIEISMPEWVYAHNPDAKALPVKINDPRELDFIRRLPDKQRKIIMAGLDDLAREEREREEAQIRRKQREGA